MTENTTASGAADRVNAYLDRRATMRSIDPEVVHGIDGPDFELTVSDLRALAASAPVAPTQPIVDLLQQLEDSLVEWSDYVTADDAPRTLREHASPHIKMLRAELGRLHAFAAFAPVAPTPPDWRELCRRLHVELFHCDKQMTCSLNEEGEPIWRTGVEVRDVLSDAKAALEANPITPEAAPVAPAPQPAPFNLRAQWLTVVYRGVEAGDEARIICEHPKVSAMSWSHALDDRDAAIAAAPKAAPASNDDSLTLGQLVSALEEAERNGALHFSLEGPLQEAREAMEANQQAVPAPVVEDVESFDTWLVKQFEFRNYYFTQRGPALMAVPFARRAYEAGRAAQPEGGAR